MTPSSFCEECQRNEVCINELSAPSSRQPRSRRAPGAEGPLAHTLLGSLRVLLASVLGGETSSPCLRVKNICPGAEGLPRPRSSRLPPRSSCFRTRRLGDSAVRPLRLASASRTSARAEGHPSPTLFSAPSAFFLLPYSAPRRLGGETSSPCLRVKNICPAPKATPRPHSSRFPRRPRPPACPQRQAGIYALSLRAHLRGSAPLRQEHALFPAALPGFLGASATRQ